MLPHTTPAPSAPPPPAPRGCVRCPLRRTVSAFEHFCDAAHGGPRDLHWSRALSANGAAPPCWCPEGRA